MARDPSERPDLAARGAGIVAGLAFAAALAGFGAALDGYDHGAWPVALLGAAGVPRAAGFNALAYVAPGLLAAFVALRRRAALAQAAGYAARVGWTLALLSALAFAAQGLLPLDATSPEAGNGRLHGVAWALWGLAFAAAALALSAEAVGARRWRTAAVHLAAGLLVFALGWLASGVLPAALAQRLAFGAWFAWLAWAGWMRRGAVR